MNLKELARIDEAMNNIADIVGFIRIHGNHLAQFRAEAVGGIVRGELGGVLLVV